MKNRLTVLYLLLIGGLFSHIGIGQNKNRIEALTLKQQLLSQNKVSKVAQLFHEKAVIYEFPKNEIASGRESIQNYYTNYTTNYQIQEVILKDRISYKGYVIDKEWVQTAKGILERIVFYKFKKNQIKSMTLLGSETLQQKSTNATATFVIDQQLDAYNSTNIDNFVATYSRNVTVANFPDRVEYQGISTLKREYARLFTHSTGLSCQIRKRIVMGSVVIDLESVTSGETRFQAIAIYEVENGLISKVTFIR